MIRVSYRRDTDRSNGNRWIGVLQVRGVLLVACGHTHHNRDVSTRAGGEAAQVCARMILEGARRPQTAEHRAAQLRNAWQSLTDGTGFTVPKTLIEQARRDCAANADAYLALVEEIRQQPDLHDTDQPRLPAAPAVEQEIGELPAWMTD